MPEQYFNIFWCKQNLAKIVGLSYHMRYVLAFKKINYSAHTSLGCRCGLCISSTSANSLRDTLQWINSCSARSIRCKSKAHDGLSGEPGHRPSRTNVSAGLSHWQNVTILEWWFPEKTFVDFIKMCLFMVAWCHW